MAARDKLAASMKEKQLQAERKKKAALFINLLRIVKESPMTGDKGKGDGDAGVCWALVWVNMGLFLFDSSGSITAKLRVSNTSVCKNYSMPRITFSKVCILNMLCH